eukprot:768453-Hanusia_phi.AAC.2
MAIEKAKKHGRSPDSHQFSEPFFTNLQLLTDNSTHYGIAGYYATMATQAFHRCELSSAVRKSSDNKSSQLSELKE